MEFLIKHFEIRKERLFLLASVVLVAITFAMVMIFSVNTISNEDILIFDFFVDAKFGKISWRDWFAPQSNHRIFFNRLIYYINMHLGNNILVINIISFLSVVGSSFFLFKLFDTKDEQRYTLLFIICVSLFNWSSYLHFLHAHALNARQLLLFAFMCLYGLKNRYYLVSFFGLICSMFTILSWGALIPILFLHFWKTKDKNLIPHLFICILGVILYKDAPYTDPIQQGINWDLSVVLPAFIGFLGNFLGAQALGVVLSLGAVVFVTTTFSYIKTKDLFIKYLLIWGVTQALMFSLGRTWDGTQVVKSPNYISYIEPLYVAIFIFLWRFKIVRHRFIFIGGILIYLFMAFDNFKEIKKQYESKESSVNCAALVVKSDSLQNCNIKPTYIYSDQKKFLEFYHRVKSIGIILPRMPK